MKDFRDGAGPPLNPFFRRENRGDQPRDYYAYVDQVERISLDEDGPATLLLDCIGAHWFDELNVADNRWGALADAPMAVIAVDLPRADFQTKSGTRLMQPQRWLRIRYAPTGPIAATRFTSFDGTGTEGAIDEAEAVGEETEVRLREYFSMDDIEEVSEEVAAACLGQSKRTDFINVFDVGQGNANALWADDHGALLYFDVGGGFLQHAMTYPAGVKFCDSNSPAVVLSHWDWDHWSSALTHGHDHLLDLTWIVPDQGPLSGQHASLAHAITRRGRLLKWPDAWKKFAFGRVEIHRCTGTEKNDNGLAVLVNGPDHDDDPVLLTGDADYRHIPAATESRRFHAVLVPHHGGKPKSKQPVPPPNSSAARRLVYSYGSPNHYGHPHFVTLHAHRSAQWTAPWTRSTVTPAGTRPQHVGIAWDERRHSTGCDECRPAQW